MVAQLFSVEATAIQVSDSLPTELQNLIVEFKDVFEETKSLPPTRVQDHSITLKNDGQLLED